MTVEVLFVCLTAIACYAMRLLFLERAAGYQHELMKAYAEKVDADGRAHRLEHDVAQLKQDVHRLTGAANNAAFARRA